MTGPRCPSCTSAQPPGASFCAGCGMPLVLGDGEAAVSDAQRRARKVDPAYTEGELVRVAGGRHQAEAELIQGLLLEEGIPSMLRRSAGFDVPDFLAAGPRDVLVPAAGAAAAHDVLLEAELAPAPPSTDRPGTGTARFLGLTVAIVAAGLLAALAAWLLFGAAP